MTKVNYIIVTSYSEQNGEITARDNQGNRIKVKGRIAMKVMNEIDKERSFTLPCKIEDNKLEIIER